MTDAIPLTFNELLVRTGIDPAGVLVFRHRPWEPALNRVFDLIVAQRRDLFECYQNTHNARAESALSRAKMLASFIRHGTGRALFVGLFDVAGWQTLTAEQQAARPLHRELVQFGMSGETAIYDRDHVLEFNLHPSALYASWSERLLVKWPGLERSWYRWADRNTFEVLALSEHSLLRTSMPRWDEISMTLAEITMLPPDWASAMSQWRGIYLISDENSQLSYVGSASGSENILQRWRDYVLTGHGGNKLLKDCDPANFRFCILQLLAQDMPQHEVVAQEMRWKRRLNTIHPFGLNLN